MEHRDYWLHYKPPLEKEQERMSWDYGRYYGRWQLAHFSTEDLEKELKERKRRQQETKAAHQFGVNPDTYRRIRDHVLANDPAD